MSWAIIKENASVEYMSVGLMILPMCREKECMPKIKGKKVLPLYEVLLEIDPDTSPEHCFDWLFLPKSYERENIENEILHDLQTHCMNTRHNYKSAKKNADPAKIYSDDSKITGQARKLEFDFYLPKYNVAIEYDELQHFTAERKLTLERYRKEDHCFDVSRWGNLCELRKNDPDPPERDWKRAYRDSIRDIRAAKNGVPLLRLFVRDFNGDTLKQTETREQVVNLINRLRLD
jgi:hypothetical protein